MSMKEFEEQVVRAIKQRMDGEVTLKTVHKNNNQQLHGLMIHTSERNITPVIYLDNFCKEYEAGKQLDDIVSAIISIYEVNKKTNDFDVETFTNFDKVKGRIVYRLVNKEMNMNILEECPHTEVLDLVKIYYVLLDCEEDNAASILVHYPHLKFWEIDEEELDRIASENIKTLCPYELTSMNDILKEMGVYDLGFEMEIPMYVLSNRSRLFGAATICYDGLLGKIASDFRNNLYILPSSVHETIILPISDVAIVEYLQAMVREVNETQVSKEEQLSDSVYFYDSEKDTVSII